MQGKKLVVHLQSQTKTHKTMFQLVARINDKATFYYEKKSRKWLNGNHEHGQTEFGLESKDEINKGIEIMQEIFGPIPVSIDFKLICLN